MKELLHIQIVIYIAATLLLTEAFGPKTTSAKTNDSSTARTVISGKIETSGYYCGGANPPEFVLQRARKKRPLSNYKLYIQEGKTNQRNTPIVDSTMTNEQGQFTFYLPPGEYLLLSEDHIDREIIKWCLHNEDIKIMDLDCIETWWQNGLIAFDVKDHPVDSINLHIKKRCFLPLGVPCLSYQGAMPP